MRCPSPKFTMCSLKGLSAGRGLSKFGLDECVFEQEAGQCLAKCYKAPGEELAHFLRLTLGFVIPAYGVRNLSQHSQPAR